MTMSTIKIEEETDQLMLVVHFNPLAKLAVILLIGTSLTVKGNVQILIHHTERDHTMNVREYTQILNTDTTLIIKGSN